MSWVGQVEPKPFFLFRALAVCPIVVTIYLTFSGSKVEGWIWWRFILFVSGYFLVFEAPRGNRERTQSPSLFSSIERIQSTHHRSCNHGQRRDHVRQARTDVPRGRANVDEAKLKPAKHSPKGESRVESCRVVESNRIHRIEASLANCILDCGIDSFIRRFSDCAWAWRGNVRRQMRIAG